MGSDHAVEFVVEEFVEALATDSRLAEDVADGGRLVALRHRHPDDGGQQSFPLRAFDQLPRQSVPAAGEAPLAQILGIVGHRLLAPLVSVSRASRACSSASSCPP